MITFDRPLVLEKMTKNLGYSYWLYWFGSDTIQEDYTAYVENGETVEVDYGINESRTKTDKIFDAISFGMIEFNLQEWIVIDAVDITKS